MASEKETREIRALMARALSTDFVEEARTAAFEAVKRIDRLGLLGKDPDEGVDDELENLRAEVARLRATRAEDLTHALARASDNQTRATEYAIMIHDMTLDSLSKAREIETLQREVARLKALPPVALHVVTSGETPQSITVSYVHNPSRLVELLRANPSKPRIPTVWGWTFKSLRVGERLRLPAGWV